MAKFRQNHHRGSKERGVGFVKIILFVAILAIALYYLSSLLSNINLDLNSSESSTGEVAVFDFSSEGSLYPEGATGEFVEHTHYALNYNEKYEQASWVAYTLTKESLRRPNVPRAKRFEDDDSVSTKSATYYDYRGSGYSRGHLAPAGDMAFDKEAMQESFFMSNMSPQSIPFNGGVWNELENMVRDWAYKNESLYVVTGPILKDGITEYIGKSKVGVPRRFYKVLLDLEGNEKKAIGFILPNEKSDVHLREYAVTVDEVEAATGLDFFTFIGVDESTLEREIDLKKWPFDEKLYQTRVNSWNNRN